jgi:UDP-3-O-[3-hydroxymyristoyl] N-acetylglucosamine deacetylase
VRGGHRLNHAILTALIADPTAWTVVEAKETRGVRAPRRGHADIGSDWLFRPTGPTCPERH